MNKPKDRDFVKEAIIQKNLAYSERNELVCFLSRLYPAHLSRHPDTDTSWDAAWKWIICIHTPKTQLSWHIHKDEKHKFKHLTEQPNDWDGHTTEEKYQRLRVLP